MLFRRRTKESLFENLRTYLWPRRSFARSIRYFLKRTIRLAATPHAIGIGVAAGVFASFFPFIGLHFIMAIAMAWLLAGNLAAAALGTALGNPLTFPVIWAANYEVGRFILGGAASGFHSGKSLGHALWHMDLVQLWEPVLKPMAVGAVPLGLAFAVVSYVLARWAASVFQHARRQRAGRRPGPIVGSSTGPRA